MELLQYRYVRGGKQFEAMSVRAEGFKKFKDAVEQTDNVEYYSYEEVSPQIYGKQIRIIGGCLNGFEGRLISKKGSKFKRLLVDLWECNLAAAIQVESEFIQLMKWILLPYAIYARDTHLEFPHPQMPTMSA